MSKVQISTTPIARRPSPIHRDRIHMQRRSDRAMSGRMPPAAHFSGGDTSEATENIDVQTVILDCKIEGAQNIDLKFMYVKYNISIHDKQVYYT
ncbi:hypothetical protein E2C01_100435 [Portunus trituberculatus]|uniref:Uncharacterized protein n=1 Tax=Portunus trituberculatus TaxID=210409 RepID=A0A5B7KC77_PORTR|nr:hypothetical protein [Portunus trituberculatus]